MWIYIFLVLSLRKYAIALDYLFSRILKELIKRMYVCTRGKKTTWNQIESYQRRWWLTSWSLIGWRDQYPRQATRKWRRRGRPLPIIGILRCIEPRKTSVVPFSLYIHFTMAKGRRWNIFINGYTSHKYISVGFSHVDAISGNSYLSRPWRIYISIPYRSGQKDVFDDDTKWHNIQRFCIYWTAVRLTSLINF